MIGFDVETSELGRGQRLVLEFRRVGRSIAFESGRPSMLTSLGDDQLLDLVSGDATEFGRLVCLALDEGRRDVITIPDSGFGCMGGHHPGAATIKNTAHQ